MPRPCLAGGILFIGDLAIAGGTHQEVRSVSKGSLVSQCKAVAPRAMVGSQ